MSVIQKVFVGRGIDKVPHRKIINGIVNDNKLAAATWEKIGGKRNIYYLI